MNLGKWLISVFAALALFMVGPSEQAEAANILTNGGFELGNTSGWTVSNSSTQPYTFDVTSDPGKVHAGNYAGRVSRYSGTQILYLFVTGPVSGLSAGAMIQSRVYIKTDNLQFRNPATGVNVVLVSYGSGGNVINWSSGETNFNGTNPYTPVDIITQLGAGAVTAQIQIKIGSPIASGAFYIDDASIQSLDSIGETTSTIPDCKLVKDSKGTPRVTINGVAKAPVFFLGNNQVGRDVIYDEIHKAASAGVNFIQFCMNAPWTGMNNSDIERVLKANPNAMIFPRVFIEPPSTWMTAHPDQIMKIENGTVSWNVPSYASDLYFNEVKTQFNLLIRYIHNSPYKDHYIGYHISGSENFYSDSDTHYYDYSEVNRVKFSQWAQTKYGTISALNTAWNKAYANFDAIQIPLPAELEAGDDGLFRDPSIHRFAADYAYYLNDLTGRRLVEIADYIKSITYNKSLTGFFYGYQLELISNSWGKGLGNCGHMGLRQVLASPNVDLLCGPCSYYDRLPGRPNGMMSIADSITAAGKLWLEEDDSRTWLFSDAEPQWYLPTEWDTLQCLRRNFGNVVGHNQAIWWVDLAGNGNYNAQSIWDSNKIAIDTYEDSIAKEQPTTPQVALIYDQEFYSWLKANSLALNLQNGYYQRTIFQSLGAQVGYYYIQDIPKIPSSVKLFVFVDTFNIDAEKKALIDTIKTDGKTLLWLYAPGYVAENSLSLANMQTITGFNLAEKSSSANPAITVASSSNPIAQGIGGRSFGSTDAISPTFYGTGGDGSVNLGNYNSGGQPGLFAERVSDLELHLLRRADFIGSRLAQHLPLRRRSLAGRSR